MLWQRYCGPVHRRSAACSSARFGSGGYPPPDGRSPVAGDFALQKVAADKSPPVAHDTKRSPRLLRPAEKELQRIHAPASPSCAVPIRKQSFYSDAPHLEEVDDSARPIERNHSMSRGGSSRVITSSAAPSPPPSALARSAG